jgi:hypothetical protein
MAMSDTHTIYVALMEEGTDCWRPVQAESLGGGLYRIVTERPDDEVWFFSVGDVVKCKERTFQGTGRELAAYEKAD